MKTKWMRYFLISVLVVVLVLLALAPGMIRSYLVANSQELVGRKLEIGNLGYNYFTSTLRVYDLKMMEANDEEVFTSFDTLMINLEPLAYLKGVIEVEQLHLNGLTSRVVMYDSTFNFDDLIDFFLAGDTISVESEVDSDPLKYRISDIRIENTNFDFDNRQVGKVNEFRGIDVFIPFIGWNQDGKSQADLAFDLKNGGSFQADFNFDPQSGDFDADVEVRGFFLDPFFQYARQFASINSLTGKMDVRSKVFGNLFEYENIVVSVDALARDFEMTDSLGKAFLGAKEAVFVAEKLDYFGAEYLINKIEVRGSYTFFRLDSASNNFFRIFKLDQVDSLEETAADTSMSVASALHYRIDQLILKEGVLDYTDNLTGEPFEYHLSDIKLEAVDLDSDMDWLVLNSTMLLNNRGNLTAELGFNPQDYENLTIDIAVERFLLPDLNIYTNYYMGHSILEGDMFYYSKSKIVDGQIESENRLVVKNAKLETTDAGIYSIPLKFAFFLLTDRNGDVNLDIPVRGDLNDPELKLSKIIWDTFKNVIDKTVLAPIDFLVGLVGGEPKELEEMIFSFTDTIPSNKHYRQLDKLLDLEQKKPGLSIQMNYFVDSRLQNEAIGKEWVSQEFGGDYQKDAEAFFKFVRKKTGSTPASLDDGISQLTQSINLDSIRTSRTEKLIEEIRRHLKYENPETQIQVIIGDPAAPENVGTSPMLKISYDMIAEPMEAAENKAGD